MGESVGEESPDSSSSDADRLVDLLSGPRPATAATRLDVLLLVVGVVGIVPLAGSLVIHESSTSGLVAWVSGLIVVASMGLAVFVRRRDTLAQITWARHHADAVQYLMRLVPPRAGSGGDVELSAKQLERYAEALSRALTKSQD